MISEQERAYFERRLAEEVQRAARAERPEVAAAHRELAHRYREVLDSGVAPTPKFIA